MLCPNKSTWSHDFLRPGAPCPYCTEVEESTATVVTTDPPPPPPPTSTATSISVGSTSTIPSTIHTAVKSVNTFRTHKIGTIRNPSQVPQYRFEVRVAHAAFTSGNAVAKFTSFPDSFKHNISQNRVFNYDDLLRQFKRVGERLVNDLSHWEPIMFPKGTGKW